MFFSEVLFDFWHVSFRGHITETHAHIKLTHCINYYIYIYTLK